MVENVIINLAILLLTGLLFSKLAKLVKLPNVTGYLIGGLIVGPALPELFGFSEVFKGFVSGDSLKSIEMVSEVALTFIAFTIGSEFKISYFKEVGMKSIIIAIFEAVVASIFVFIIMIAIGKSVAFSLVIASIASATAPAATLMVVKQYKAKGPVTNTLLSVVALDDAVALIVFGFSFTVASRIAMTTDVSSTPLALSIAMPFIEIIVSILMGAIFGFILAFLVNWFKGRSNRICVVLAVLLLNLGLGQIINKAFDMNISNLLASMMIGAILINFSKHTEEVTPLVERFTPPIFMLFFTLSGAELSLTSIKYVGLAGICYIVLRALGKYFGAFFGATIVKSEKTVKKYLGPCLLPQAGVAIGLSLIAVKALGDVGMEIRTIVLCATLVYELIGPLIVKLTLRKAGEIDTISA